MSPGAIAIAAFVFLLAFAAYSVVSSGLRMARDRSPLRIHRLARAQGLPFPGSDSEAGVRAAAVATRRCTACAVKDRCDACLARADYAGLRRICPNAAFLDRLARQAGSRPGP